MKKQIPIFSWNTKTKEFTVLGKKFDGVNGIEDFTNYIYTLDNQLRSYKDKIDKSRELLGNYKHYSTPTEEQLYENEDIVNNTYKILNEGGSNNE